MNKLKRQLGSRYKKYADKHHKTIEYLKQKNIELTKENVAKYEGKEKLRCFKFQGMKEWVSSYFEERIAELERLLKKENIYFFDIHGEKQKLSRENCQDFYEGYEMRFGQTRFFADWYISREQAKKAAAKKMAEIYQKERGESLAQYVFADTNACKKNVKYIFAECRKITLPYILGKLPSNPHYKRYCREISAKILSFVNLNDNILEEIPENYADLYPNARQLKRHFVIHCGPTNSGKTYEALQALKKADSGIYLAPLRLLAYEIFERLNTEGVPCSLLTGEERMDVPFSNHISSTVEMLELNTVYERAVIDEAQMLSDPERGGAWTRAILGVCAEEVHICCAPEALNVIKEIIALCGDSYETHFTERKVPLYADSETTDFPNKIKKGDALIVFSRRSVHAVASELKNAGMNPGIIYGSLPYDVRYNEARRFKEGETDVLVATDAIGMGLNLPIKRIVFLETKKFNGKEIVFLEDSQVKQIAGRAGRAGIYDEGLYTADFPSDKVFVENCVNRNIKNIEEVRVPFSERLIHLNVPLSRIFERWMEMPEKKPFKKSEIGEKLNLCHYLEKLTEDKTKIYELITIPFDESSGAVCSKWRKMCDYVLEEKKPELQEVTADIRTKGNLEVLETSFKTLDLVYYFYYKFWRDKDILESIMYLKKDVSSNIMELLEKQVLSPKVCKYCGRVLPWNFSYGSCSVCFLERRQRK
ncbi:MAG: helicase [Firmicutes bacterium]|nr:helicase [Bacillota bacterium]